VQQLLRGAESDACCTPCTRYDVAAECAAAAAAAASLLILLAIQQRLIDL